MVPCERSGWGLLETGGAHCRHTQHTQWHSEESRTCPWRSTGGHISARCSVVHEREATPAADHVTSRCPFKRRRRSFPPHTPQHRRVLTATQAFTGVPNWDRRTWGRRSSPWPTPSPVPSSSPPGAPALVDAPSLPSAVLAVPGRPPPPLLSPLEPVLVDLLPPTVTKSQAEWVVLCSSPRSWVVGVWLRETRVAKRCRARTQECTRDPG